MTLDDLTTIEAVRELYLQPPAYALVTLQLDDKDETIALLRARVRELERQVDKLERELDTINMHLGGPTS